VVAETEHTLAILDAFPVTKGHTLVIPKASGYASILEMPPDLLGELFKQVGVVSNAVKKAFNADGINIVQNNGSASGQEVFHVHVHIIPRYKDDKLGLKFPASAKDMINSDTAKQLLDEIKKEL